MDVLLAPRLPSSLIRNPNDRRILGTGDLMLKTEVDWIEKRKGLTAMRDSLFRQLAANPSNTETGQEIKNLTTRSPSARGI